MSELDKSEIPTQSRAPETQAAPEARSEGYSAKEYLDRLKREIELARNESDRREFENMAKKLEAKMKEESEILAQQAGKGKDYLHHKASETLASFRADLSPEQRSRFNKVESSMGVAIEKTKAGALAAKEKAGEIASQATEKIAGADAAKALEKGDVKAAAQKVGESVFEKGKMATLVMSLDNIADRLEEELPFVGLILAAIIRFFANLARGFLPKVDKEKIDEAKGKAKEAAADAKQRAESAVERFGSMDREKLREEAVRETQAYVEERFFNGYKLTPERQKAFLQAMREHEFPTEALNEIAKRYSEGGRVSVSDGYALIEKYVFSNSLLVLKLAVSGVIPIHKLGIAVVDEAASTSKKHFALTLGGLGIEPSYFGFEELQKIADSVKDDPTQRATYLYLLYKPASVFASIMGTMVSSTASLAVGLATSTEVDSLKMGRDIFKGHTSGNYQELIKNFAALEAKLGADVRYASQLGELEKLTAAVRNNYALLQALEDESKTPWSFKTNKEIRKLLTPDALRELDAIPAGGKYREFVRRQMASSPALGLAEALKNWAAKLGGSQGGRILEQTEKLRGILDVQSKLAAQEAKVLKWLGIMKDIRKTASISRVQDATMLMVKDEQALRELTPAFLKLGSEGMKHFFNGIPLIGLAVGARDLSKDKTREAGLWDWAKMIGSALSMPVAGFVLMGNVSFGKDGVENVEQGLIGATLLTASIVYMAKNPKNIIPFATGITTLQQAGETISAGVRWARVVGRVAPKFGKALAEALPKVAKSGDPRKAVAGAAVAAAALAIYVGFKDNPYEASVKEGLVDPGTGKMTDQGRQRFASLPIESRKELLDGISYHALGEVGATDAETSYEPGSYNVIARTKEQAKKLQPAVDKISQILHGNGIGTVELPVIPKS